MRTIRESILAARAKVSKLREKQMSLFIDADYVELMQISNQLNCIVMYTKGLSKDEILFARETILSADRLANSYIKQGW